MTNRFIFHIDNNVFISMGVDVRFQNNSDFKKKILTQKLAIVILLSSSIKLNEPLMKGKESAFSWENKTIKSLAKVPTKHELFHLTNWEHSLFNS